MNNFLKVILTFIIVAVCMVLLVLSYNLFGIIGIISTFIVYILLAIGVYHYTNKKDEERCPLNKK